jgi:hypothetical protein
MVSDTGAAARPACVFFNANMTNFYLNFILKNQLVGKFP